MKKKINRRFFLLSTINLFFIKNIHANNFCSITPKQPTGPFYKSKNLSSVTDMTNGGRAIGEVIEIKGRVLDNKCNPQPSCQIKIWQANAFGKYNHENDISKNKIDIDFIGYNKIITDRLGYYKFITIIPGSYKINKSIIRPPHIHILVEARNGKKLTTQLYFKDHPFNNGDFLYKNIKKKTLVNLSLSKINNKIKSAYLNIVI